MMPGQAPYREPQPYARASVTDGKAIASLVLGILACIGCLAVTGIPAIIVGFLARGSIARSNGARSGSGIALAGIITGFGSLAMSVVTAMLFVGVMHGATGAFHRAQKDSALNDLKVIQAVAEAWRASNPSDCPTPKRLRDEHELSSSSRLQDPWGTPFVIECSGTTVTAVSYGPDKKVGTADDLRYP